jgi:transcriptional regulator with PAS, ATPase and Fis domain
VFVVALECGKPDGAPSRHVLDGIDEVRVGRGKEREVERRAAERLLSLRLPEASMSQLHFTLTRSPDGFVLADTGSRNGTFLGGERITRKHLVPGQVVEAGRTFFVLVEEPRGGPFENARPLDEGPLGAPHPVFETLSAPLATQYRALLRIAPSLVSVLIEAESGTGKELIARAIHEASGRKGPLVAVNCGALPANLVEGELFGHKKGAFSGAVEDRLGLVRSADRGTLLLDEIGDLPATAQAAFLRVLQEREVLPIGGTRPVSVDVRFVAATHRHLDEMVQRDRFRADLRTRVAGYTLRLPALRERREDLGLLVARLLDRHRDGSARPVLTSAAARALFAYSWPGNIRELEKALEASLALAAGGPIELDHLPETVRSFGSAPSPSGEKALKPDDARRRDELVALLREHGGNISAVARATGKARIQIQRWIRRFGIEP